MVRMVLRLTLDLPPACHDAPVVEKQIRSYDPASSTETTGHPLGLVLPAPPTTSTQVGQDMGFLVSCTETEARVERRFDSQVWLTPIT